MFDQLFHADWSKHESKRWVVRASKCDSRWTVSAPVPVGPVEQFLSMLLKNGKSCKTLAGFDFPIGIPAAYGKQANLDSFVSALPLFGVAGWRDFYDVASKKADINVFRPFYPARPGGTKRSHLIDALGLESSDDLFRLCERISRASPLFWTLGAKQVGKAAISGWREVILPAIQQGAVVWPFEGQLTDLSSRGELVIAETYPAEAYRHIGINFFKSGKRHVEGRAAQSKAIRDWAEKIDVQFERECLEDIETGFLALGPDGEDAFDALAGVLSMIDVADGRRLEGVPENSEVRHLEGWMLGQLPISY